MSTNMKGMELAEKLLNLPFVKGVTTDTTHNLKSALVVEEFVAKIWFPELSRMAYAEGREDLGKLFDNVGKGEQSHADTLRKTMQKFGISEN